MDNDMIYVFSAADRDKLMSMGDALVKSDTRNGIYVFREGSRVKFADLPSSGVRYCRSPILTF